MVDYLIHQIDECCWIKDAWPVSADGIGGRVPGSTRLRPEHRRLLDRVHVRRRHQGLLRLPAHRPTPQRLRHLHPRHEVRRAVLRQRPRRHRPPVQGPADRARTTSPGRRPDDAFSPWQYEWNDFIASIRNDRPHNEGKRAVYSDLTTLMGRAACHTGQTVTWDEMMKSNFQFCDYLDKLNYDSPAPVKADDNGQFPVPIPAAWKEV